MVEQINGSERAMNYNKQIIWTVSLIGFFLAVAIPAKQCHGQASQYEFVQSTSPLGDGRTVTRTLFSDPNKPSQVVISAPPRIANLPPSNSFPRLSTGPVSRPPGSSQGSGANSTPRLAPPPENLDPAQFALPPHLPDQAAGNSNSPVNGQLYPYPASGTATTGYGRFANGPPRPLIKLRTLPANAYVGQGWLGQPTAYVPGEPIRNIIRYIMP